MLYKIKVSYYTISINRLLYWKYNRCIFFFSSFERNEKKESKKIEDNNSEKEHFSFDKKVHYFKENLLNDTRENDKLTNVIFNKIVDEHKLNEEKKKDGKKKKITEENITINENNIQIKEKERKIYNTEVNCDNAEDMEISKSENYTLTKNEIIIRKKKLIPIKNSNENKKNNELICSKQNNSFSSELDKRNSRKEKLPIIKKENGIIDCTLDKNINNILVNHKGNKLILNEKKKDDHFYKIFFSSKKVKIIKSQNHPIFIHLYKLATDMNYREKQEKILLTNKKIILERQKNHITRIYTNSINNLKDFHSFDNFILLSNKLLKKLSFLYSFKNGVLAEISHKFHFDNVGFPFLAFCFYNVNYEDKKKEKKEVKQELLDSNLRINYHYIKNKKDTSNIKNKNLGTNSTDFNEINVFHENEDIDKKKNNVKNKNEEISYKEEESLEYLCNGDIGTLIRSCFLLKWQCIFNIDDLSKKRKKKNSYKNNDIKNIYDIDFFHPLTLRASSGYLLDIPYKSSNLNEIYEYTKENKILLLKYNSNSDFYINYKKMCSEDDKMLNLLKKSKGVFLIIDNCNNIEKKYKLIHKNYINISNNLHSDDIFDNIYYVNLKNDSNKKLDLISVYSIFMYILKVNYFKHIPQSSYVYFQ
ncbi:conserved Plasmodium protein, unknown function [Plasmodium relictum]|uniref:Uncharacterized protein n=1 Tax=Plasmodium relictum TaxID=85471 RepID=A0A1J1H2M6_PLARL|nr:conserved Plasmodium protein, unknown function [Plasmodium relictum]CRG99155.1 conserved Plasmodium protein, unknown function [Plasmodium relictum]